MRLIRSVQGLLVAVAILLPAHQGLAAGTTLPGEADYQSGLRHLQGGKGTPSDQVEARRAFERAAAQHHSGAELELGFLEEDPARATSWFREAARHGNPEAQYNLGVSHAMGIGVEHDAAQAINLFERAALQGFPDAVYNLAIMHMNGDGVPRDRVLGCGLLAAAESLGVETEPGPVEDCDALQIQDRQKADQIARDRSLWSRRL